MNQSIDRDQGDSDLTPQRIPPDHQQVSQSHIQNFVGSAMQAEKWRNQSLTHPAQPAFTRSGIGLGEARVDPGYDIAAGNVADEQKQRIGELIEIAVAKLMARQGTALDQVRPGATCAPFR
jgi:hypothetical protein